MSGKPDDTKLILKNRRATFDFEIVETLEAGIELVGSEVKSLRAGKVSLTDCYAHFERNELWLRNMHIAEFPQANQFNHEPNRPRKLLLHRHELDRLSAKVRELGLTLVPLQIYFRGQRVKVELGVGRGRKQHDKRQHLKEQQDKRDMAAAIKERGR